MKTKYWDKYKYSKPFKIKRKVKIYKINSKDWLK